MGVYDRQISTAKRLIAAKGQSVLWRQISDGTPTDSLQPWKPGTTTNIDRAVSIVFLPDDRREHELLRLLGKTEVPHGRLIGLMAATSFVPTLKDVVVRGSEILGVEAIDPIAPNGEIIMYTVRFAV